MKGKIFLIVIILLTGYVLALPVAKADLDGKDWQLINRDSRGNLLYLAPAVMEKPVQEGIKRVWMKFETQAETSPSPILFLNEVDCNEGRLKRLEVELYSSAGHESSKPFRSISFEGRWDRPSAGIEQVLYETVCPMGGKGKM